MSHPLQTDYMCDSFMYKINESNPISTQMSRYCLLSASGAEGWIPLNNS